MLTPEISIDQEMINDLFEQPSQSSAKIVRVSEEQIELLKNASLDEKKVLLRRIYEEGRDERKIYR